MSKVEAYRERPIITAENPSGKSLQTKAIIFRNFYTLCLLLFITNTFLNEDINISSKIRAIFSNQILDNNPTTQQWIFRKIYKRELEEI